jgi:mannitol-1-phosphate 5-dehydrogenase
LKTFVQYGAGNIGRGFIGALFSNAGYAVKFIDVNMEVIDALNERKEYPVRIVSKKGNTRQIIKNVSGIDGRDRLLVSQTIAEADIMATAVGVNILPRIVNNIVEGLRLRWKNSNAKPLDIIICENLIDADKLLAKLITEQLNDTEKQLFDSKVGLVEASIGRMVPVMTEEMKKQDNLLVCVEKYGMLPVDKAAFKGEIPEFPELFPFSPFEFFIRRKLYIHNMGHALTAYLGYIENCTYIWQAIQNPYIKVIVQRAMLESAKALSKHFNVPIEKILEQIDDLLLRFSNAELGDTVARVGRDLKRKLSAADRFAGAVKLCEAEGIEPIYISAGISAGLFFDTVDDEGTKYVKDMLTSSDIDNVLTNICEIDINQRSAAYIKSYYELLKSGNNLSELLNRCEDFAQEMLEIKNIV